MNKLLSTTAIVLAMSLPLAVSAQTNAPAAKPAAQGQTDQTNATRERSGDMSGFLAARQGSDVFASELMGHDVYARRVQTERTSTDDSAARNDSAAANRTETTATERSDTTAAARDQGRGLSSMNRADLDDMDNIGQINDIVLSNDGEVRAIVIGVGGFLGMGEKNVAVTMDQVTFSADPDDRDEMYIVVNTGADLLQKSPNYDRMAMAGDGSVRDDARTQDRTPFTAPKQEREGYSRVEATDVSSEMLVGKSVYATNEDSVGEIDDLIVGDDGDIKDVIIDFGGFLGLGTSQVAVGFDELTILSNKAGGDVRVYIDATKEQVQDQPLYKAVN